MASNLSTTTSTSANKIPLNASTNYAHQMNSFVFSFLSKRKGNLFRIAVLFTMGSSLCLVLNILQMEYKSNLFPSNVLLFLQTLWWVIPLGGIAASEFVLFAFLLICFGRIFNYITQIHLFIKITPNKFQFTGEYYFFILTFYTSNNGLYKVQIWINFFFICVTKIFVSICSFQFKFGICIVLL